MDRPRRSDEQKGGNARDRGRKCCRDDREQAEGSQAGSMWDEIRGIALSIHGALTQRSVDREGMTWSVRTLDGVFMRDVSGRI